MLRNLDKYIGNTVTFFAVAAYFELFRFMMIPYSFRVLAQLAAFGIMIVLIILRLIYQPEKLIKMNFALPVTLLLLGAIPSYFVAQADHSQSLLSSAYANRMIWFYLLYFFVHVYQISIKYIIRLIIAIGIFSVFLYYVQYTMYPTRILDINIIEGRGTIRLFVYGMLCTQAAYFYFLNRFFENNRISDLILSMVSLSIFILQGTRQLLFALAFLTLINLFFSKRVRARFIKIGVLALASFAVFLIFREIFFELTKVSSSQVNDLAGGIRLKAARFFLTTFMPSEWAYLFGNGVSAEGSIYDQKMSLYAMRYGFYLADIGIIGDYIKYGIIFVLAGLIMLFKSIWFKISPEYNFLKYYILTQCFTLVTGYGLFGGVDVILLLILYVFDKDRANQSASQSIKELANP